MLPKLFGSNTSFPMNFSASGHWTLNFFTSSKEEGYYAAKSFLVNKVWSSHSASALVDFVTKSIKPKFNDVVTEVYLSRRLKSKKMKGTDKDSLNQKDINKLHHFFGHAHPSKLENLIRTSGRWNDNSHKI